MLANVSRIEFSDTAQELHTALVSGRANDWFLLDNAPGCTRAKVAASCLLEPEIGDTVLVSVSACGGISYILAILAKPEHRGGSLRLPGGAATIVMGGEYQGTIFTSEMVETKTPVAMAVTMTPLTQAPMARGMIMQ